MNISHTRKALIAVSLLFVLQLPAHANTAAYKEYANQWAELVFNSPEESKQKGLKALYEDIKSASSDTPDDAALLAWSGIIAASYAGEKGGLGALKVAKKARDSLSQALAMDPFALDGGAATSLGTLYYKVPGWPIGFGNDKKANELLATSVRNYPNSITSQYFYGDFLIEQKRYDEAHKVYSFATQLKPREDSLLADTNRLALMRDALSTLERKMN